MVRVHPVLCLAFASCIGGETEPDPEACALAVESQTCPSCTSGPMTCTFGDTSVTEGSCGECQARASLYQALCDAGEDAARAEIEEDTVCEPATCEVYYDACSDPCLPTCVLGSEIPDSTCDMACLTPLPPPGVCAWNGSGCDWVATP